ncbi:hypothetical protein BASA50_000872 [Batrachochytrium salamandrivorans]|uniref:Reelin domain-containing protein n=1 Tax=Batrachochytrium salamandrivorans TaxID=1357716 RepID=A0ABQ8ESW7_9FUNG|nr:hypothetical protein BASA61_008068 [Batrachochytrium salamandrivorans]KAH6583876.1 hypothetical protein BASA61_007815 [Batrachochytrium salamandrivorans]KAH6585928.1 hypothetical protein BASA50_000872 [Batrachochytrium salamandrivorans]KAH9249131.1 hypothetical protein BASA81_013155 [Batrachochytrium salamandrivorans]KAH9275791.1 hypothetical protein BASA83_001593 [Batrachochytrium salamandrivorans]
MLFRSVVTAIFAVAFSSTTVSALPSGAPKCAINATVIGAAHKKSDDPTLGYSVSITPNGASWEITVTNTAGREYFQGLLMYVATDMEPKNHLGKFTFDKDNFRPQTKSICDAAKITGDLDATFTHSSPTKKAVGMKFMWTPSPADMAASGNPMIYYAFADNDGKDAVTTPAKFMTGKMPMEFRSQTQPASGGVYGGHKNPKMRKVIKCIPKKHKMMMMAHSKSSSIPEPAPSVESAPASESAPSVESAPASAPAAEPAPASPPAMESSAESMSSSTGGSSY